MRPLRDGAGDDDGRGDGTGAVAPHPGRETSPVRAVYGARRTGWRGRSMTASTAWRTPITATSMHPSRHHRPSRARPSFLSRDVAAIVPVDVALGLSATWAGVGRDAREHLAVERLYDQAARGWRRLRGLALSTRLLRSLALARDVLDCRTSARLTGDIMANPPSQASPPRAEEGSRRAPSWAAPRPVRERWSGVRGDRPRPTWPWGRDRMMAHPVRVIDDDPSRTSD